jgi:hypothetical protein
MTVAETLGGNPGSVSILASDIDTGVLATAQSGRYGADRIDRLMIRLATMVAACGARLLRAKGALRTDHGTRLVEWSSGQVRSSPLVFDGPSRFELLFGPGAGTAALAFDSIAGAIEPVLREALSAAPPR